MLNFDEDTYCKDCKHHVAKGKCNAAGCAKLRQQFKAQIVPDDTKKRTDKPKTCFWCNHWNNIGFTIGQCDTHLSETVEYESCSRWIPKKDK